jgi:uncharacterized protein YndB with AHSA1/START domain
VAATTEPAAAPPGRELLVTRLLDAPRALVFKAWTQPEHIARWWGPQGFTIIACAMDIRIGGRFRQCQRSPDGVDFWKQGVYREIVEPERIVFTFAWEDAHGNPGHETLVTVRFEDVGGKTRLTLHQAVFETTSGCEEHRIGWTSCLQRFADYVAMMSA